MLVLTLGTGQRGNVPRLGSNIVDDRRFEPRNLERWLTVRQLRASSEG